MMSFVSIDSSPDVVFNASLRQLQRLVYQYQANVVPQRYSVWVNNAAMHASDAALRGTRPPPPPQRRAEEEVVVVVVDDAEDAEWRFYFLLCMRYWKTSVGAYPMLVHVAQATLTIAMELGRVSATEARELMSEVEHRARHHDMARMATSSIIEFERAALAGEKFRVTELARRFDELAISDQWLTDGDGDGDGEASTEN
jgi:hypothetical protein